MTYPGRIMSGKRHGPKPRGEFIGKSCVTSTRLTPACKREIEKSAKRSGRSLSQEIEFLIWRGLRLGGPSKSDVAAYMRSLADELEASK